MSQTPEVSILVPTLNEAENLPELARRIDAAMAGRSYELILIDDNSRDATQAVCAELAKQYPLKLMVRTQPRDGLSGAVLHGMAEARGKYLAVMDADLQHPPESLPDLLGPLMTGQADFVIGSRYVAGGGIEGNWGLFRQINSKVATLLARPFSGNVTDPMSGFFALRADTYKQARRLTPLGYKIALELMCKCRVKQVREIPIHFGLRAKGESKLSIKQQFRYLEHLSRLYDFQYPRLSPMLKFLIATAIGWCAALGVFAILVKTGLAPSAAIAAALSYPAAILATFILHLRYVRAQREFLARPRPWADFMLICLVEWAACVLTAAWLQARLDRPRAWEIFLISYAVATITRYALRKEFLQDLRGLGT